MKKFKSLIFAVVIVSAAVSCQEQVNPAEYIVPEDAYEMPAVDSTGTAVSLSIACPDGLVFSAPDSISVFSMAQPDVHNVFKFVSQAEGKAVFEGVAVKSATYCVVYPWDAANKIGFVDGGGQMCSVTASVPQEQAATGNPNVYVALADSSSLHFYPTLAKVKIPLFKPAADTTKGVGVSVVGLAGESLSGPMSVTIHKGAAPSAVSAAATGSRTRYKADEINMCSDTSYVEMFVAPQTLTTGYKISVTLEDGHTQAVKDIADPVSIPSNVLTELKAFEYAAQYYADFKFATDVRPDFGGYKLDFNEADSTGRVWFFTTELPAELFKNRVNVTKVIIPSFITGLGTSSMQGMTGLKEIVFEPGSKCEYFGLNSIQGATALESITIPKSVVTLGQSCLQGAVNLTSVKFEEGTKCEMFGQNCFYNVKSLQSLEVPATVKELGPYCLQNMLALNNLTFAEGSQLETMNTLCIEGDNLIGTLRIPGTVKTIVNPCGSTKNYSPKLTIYCYCETPPEFNGKFCNGVNQILHIYVPKGTIDAYKNAKDSTGAAGTGWSRYAAKFVEME